MNHPLHDHASLEAPPLKVAEAERELVQLRRAESLIVAIRWVVMVAWVPIFWGAELPTARSTVYSIHACVALYTAVCHYLVRYSPAIRATAIVTTLGDGVGVFAMCMVTGGIDSAIYPYFYLHLLTTAIRFGGMNETFAALGLDVVFSLVLFALAPGSTTAGQLALRVYYLFFVAVIVGVLSRDAKTYYRRALKEGDKAGLLLSVNREITATLDLSELLSRLLREAANVIPCRGACLILLDRSGERSEQVASAGGFPRPTPNELEASLRGGVLRRASEEGALVVEGAESLSQNLRCESVKRFVKQSFAVVPIRRRRVLGFLVVADKPGRQPFDTEDVALLSAVADQAAVAIENAWLMAEVSEARDRRRELLWQLIHAEEEERKRIAGEIHDRMGHRFFEFYYGIDQCREAVAHGARGAPEMLARLADEARICADQIRDLMNELRPSILDDFGFVEALRESVASLSAQGNVAVILNVEDDLKVARPEVNVMLFRIFQEAMLNVRKHSGASRVVIQFGSDRNGCLDLAIRDDGRGFDARSLPRGHYGLLYMRERAEACGGHLDLRSAPGEGVEIHVRVPVE